MNQYENFTVRFTVTYETVVTCKKEDLENEVFDLNIPKAKGFQYVDDSFTVNAVENEHGKDINADWIK